MPTLGTSLCPRFHMKLFSSTFWHCANMYTIVFKEGRAATELAREDTGKVAVRCVLDSSPCFPYWQILVRFARCHYRRRVTPSFLWENQVCLPYIWPKLWEQRETLLFKKWPTKPIDTADRPSIECSSISWASDPSSLKGEKSTQTGMLLTECDNVQLVKWMRSSGSQVPPTWPTFSQAMIT